MRAKAIIHAELVANKKEIEENFLTAVRTAFPENPPAELNTIAITSPVPPILKDKNAQAIINYFQPRYQQLVALEKMLEKMPDISRSFEEGVSQQSDQVALQQILDSIKNNSKEFSVENPTGYEQTLSDYKKDLKEMQQQNIKINDALKKFASFKEKEKTENLKKITVDLAKSLQQLEQIEQKIAAITVAIKNSDFSYSSPKGVNRQDIQKYLLTQPVESFQKELQNFRSITVPPEIPKILSADQINIDILSVQIDLVIKDTIDDLTARYQFYQNFNEQYHNASDVLENIKDVNNTTKILENDVKKFRKEILQTKALFEQKKTTHEKLLQIDNIRQQFRDITREKITLLRNEPNQIAAITYSKDKSYQIDLAIKSADELIGRYQSLQNSVQENITERGFAEYLKGIADHLADLKTYKANVEQVKQEYEEEIEEIQQKHLAESSARQSAQSSSGKIEVDQSRLAESSTVLAKKIIDLSQKIMIANEYLYFLRGERPPSSATVQKTSLKIIEIPFSAVMNLLEEINSNLKQVNQSYDVLQKNITNLTAALPKLAENITDVRQDANNLQEKYHKTIENFIKEFENKYEDMIKQYPEKDSPLKQVFYNHLLNFKNTLLVAEPKTTYKISHEDRQMYLAKITEHLQSRDSFTTRFFRDVRLTQQKDIIGKMAVKFINKLDSPAQLESLLTVLLSWNAVAENLAGKKYRMGMSSGLAKVFEDIRIDVEEKQKAQIQVTPGKSSGA